MIKFRLYFDKDAETQWLNSMADRGLAMTGFFAGFYIFEPCEKGKYTYQIDFGDRFGYVSNDYREFMEEAGIEIVQIWGWWILLRKVDPEGDFQLYTDVDSRITHYSRIRKMFKVAAVIELLCLFMELLAAMEGFCWGYALAMLIGAILICLVNALFRTNEILAKLEEQKTGIASQQRKRKISLLLSLGLILNSCVLMMNGFLPDYIYLPLQILAVIFLVVGICSSAAGWKK